MTTQDILIDPQAEKGEFDSGQVLTISSGHFIHDVFSSFLPPLLPLIIERLSLSLTLAGSLGAFLQLPAILNPLIGHFADKYNLRYLVIISPALTATLMSVLGLAPNFTLLAIFLTITGISSAFFHAPAPAMAAQISGNRVGKGMSWFMAGGELARTFGPLVAVWAVSTWTFEGMFRVMVIGWLTSVILFWRLRDIPIRSRKSGSLQSVLPKLRTIFLPITIIAFFRMFMVASMTSYLPTYLSQKGLSLFMAGASLSILEIAGFFGALSSGTISDKFGRKPILIFSIVVSPILMIIFLYVSGWSVVPLLLLYGFVSISAAPIFLALIQDHFPDNRAVSNGIYISMAFLFRSLILVLIGVAGDAFGLGATFIGCALISLLGLIGIPLLPAEKI